MLSRSDELKSLLVNTGEAFHTVEHLIDDQLLPLFDRRALDGVAKIETTAHMATRIAEQDRRLGHDLRTSHARYRELVLEEDAGFRRELDTFNRLQLTPPERQLAGQLESRFRETSAAVARILALSDAQEKARAQIRNLDSRLDDKLQNEVRAHAVASLHKAEEQIARAVEASRVIGDYSLRTLPG